MVRLPPISNWTYTLFPYTTLFRSGRHDPDRGIDRSGNLYGMKAGRQVEPDDLPDAGAARAMFMGCGGQGGGARGGVHPGGGGQRYADARRILDSQGEEAGMAFGDGSAGRNDELDLRSRAQRCGDGLAKDDAGRGGKGGARHDGAALGPAGAGFGQGRAEERGVGKEGVRT